VFNLKQTTSQVLTLDLRISSNTWVTQYQWSKT